MGLALWVGAVDGRRAVASGEGIVASGQWSVVSEIEETGVAAIAAVYRKRRSKPIGT